MKIVVYINFILTLILIGCFAWLIIYKSPTNTITSIVKEIGNDNVSYVDKCGDDCQKKISDAVTEALQKNIVTTEVQVTPTAVPVVKTVTSTKKEVSYIPITGPITSVSSSWYDAPGTDFYLNFEGDYGKSATATWDASLKVAHGNGTVYARIFDLTHGIAVNGSEISVTDKADLTQVTSGSLSFWSGNNHYIVQIRSLNTFEVTFGSGRVKINY